LGTERKAATKFIKDFINKKQQMFPNTFRATGNIRTVEQLPAENLTAYKKPDFDDEDTG